MKIEHLATASLIPYARNAKKHDASQVAKLAGSIREFGFNNPVLIDSDNGIIAGHGRVLAAQSLALESVPCIRLGHLSDTQRRAYILADNRLAEIGGGWDEEMLKLELADLAAADLDVAELGFDTKELSQLVLGDGSGALDEMPELPTGEREPFQQMKFTLHDDEVAIIERAISVATGTTTEQMLAFTNWLRGQKVTAAQINKATGTLMGSHYLTVASQPAIPTPDAWKQIVPLVHDVPQWITELIDRKERMKLSDNENGRGAALARICKEWADQANER